MAQINPRYKKENIEIIEHILCKLNSEYSDIVTVVEGISCMTLCDIKEKIWAFHKCKIMDNNSSTVLAILLVETSRVIANTVETKLQGIQMLLESNIEIGRAHVWTPVTP